MEGGGSMRGRMGGRKSDQEPEGWQVHRRGDQEGRLRQSLVGSVLWDPSACELPVGPEEGRAGR